MRVRNLPIVSLLLFAAGCGSGRAKMANAGATSDVKASGYDRGLAEWSRTEKVYERLETRLIVSATYKSGSFRDAYADEYSRRYLLGDAARDEMKRREHADADSYHEFFFAAYTPESRWNDFSRRESVWKVRLYDDAGNQVEPLVVTRVKNDDPALKAFFPYFTMWTRGYVVKFPRSGLSPDSKSVRLQITSALGAAEMTYDRTRADTAAPVRVENGGSTPTASKTP